MTQRPKLGQWCKIEKRAVKGHPGDRTEWVAADQRLYLATTGMFIGWRTVFSGKNTWVDRYTGWVFTPEEAHEVWLFVEGERRNPIRAFPRDVCILESPAPDADDGDAESEGE